MGQGHRRDTVGRGCREVDPAIPDNLGVRPDKKGYHVVRVRSFFRRSQGGKGRYLGREEIETYLMQWLPKSPGGASWFSRLARLWGGSTSDSPASRSPLAHKRADRTVEERHRRALSAEALPLCREVLPPLHGALQFE